MSSQPLRLLPRMEQSSTFWCSNLYQPPRSAAADNHLFAIFALACGNRSCPEFTEDEGSLVGAVLEKGAEASFML
ncbi:zinc finger protein [Nephila pilipes]|uniref:Zinc finger protein n=1 Tax=Nephila pilipes TaxID=299642 RepID=A0A8X6QX49_NEPPI|nr:zinc finger protein [Nephila pilipes]